VSCFHQSEKVTRMKV